MSASKIKPELIHLIAIRVLKSHLEVSDKLMDKPRKIDGFKMGLSSESGFNFDEKLMRFRLGLKLFGHDKSEKPIGIEGEYAIEFKYHIENMDDFVTKKDDHGKYLVSDDLGGTIISISYSTARGIILERTQGTDFNGIILPVINPKKLLVIESDNISANPEVKEAIKS